MGIRSFFSSPLARYIVNYNKKWASNPIACQRRIFRSLVEKGAQTKFGRDHGFNTINNFEDYKKQVPVRDYEDFSIYIKQIIDGNKDVLWPGKPLYLSKTSGTTSGVKYIPITKESMPNHMNSARNAMFSYIHESGNSKFLDRKLIFLSGSPELDNSGAIPTGRLSGIVNHHIPSWLKGNQLPSYQTNIVDDWEEKLERIVDETLDHRLGLISGIPPWVQMYFDRIIARTGKQIKEVFPDFSIFIHGGVNFEPYRNKLFDSIGKKIDSIETYPASEGFIAYQDSQTQEGLLLLLNSGIFFEFIPVEEYFNDNYSRLTIEEVEENINYVVVLSTNAGLWSYSLEDTVKFVSTQPYRIIVTGRVKHFISAFGEHVIGEEVEKAMKYAVSKQSSIDVIEFSVAPQVNPTEGLPLHEWFIEFRRRPKDLEAFENALNLELQKLNTYYNDLISGKILRPLKIIMVEQDGFRNYMKSMGKLGGQNKVPRLANDRTVVDELVKFSIKV